MRPSNPLPQQIELARSRVRLVARTDAKAASFTTCAISGPGGLGKTHLVTETLREMKVRFEVVRGTLAALFERVYALRKGGVLVLDDADNLVLGGGETMNFMKQLLFPQQVRTIVRQTVKARRNADQLDPDPTIAPPCFDVQCGVIWLTNIDLTNSTHVNRKLVAHIQPLIDRGLAPIRLSSDPLDILEYVVWLATHNGLLKKANCSLQEANDAISYFIENAWRFPSLSVRTLLQIAATRGAEPSFWRDILDSTLLPEPTCSGPLPRTPRFLAGGAVEFLPKSATPSADNQMADAA